MWFSIYFRFFPVNPLPETGRLAETGAQWRDGNLRAGTGEMTLELWTAVDQYITETVVAEDHILRAATEAGVAAGLPQISVTPSQGKLLYLLARVQGARAILEIGTLVGYSTIWLARAVGPNGRVITLESEAAHAAVARDNVARAGLEETVDIRVGKALDTLPGLVAAAPFDLVFIDADKESNPQYFEWAM